MTLLLTLPLLISAVTSEAASEYPKVVRRDGNVCVQELDAAGAVKESCHPEKEGIRLSEGRPSARFMPGAPLDDPRGSTRGVAELAVGIIGATIPTLIVAAIGPVASTTGVLLTGVLSILVAGATTWILHSIFDGQAGFGWGILGAIVGGGVATLVGLVMTLTSAAGIITVAVLGVLLPPLSAAIALEARDGALRRGEVSTLGPRPDVVVATF